MGAFPVFWEDIMRIDDWTKRFTEEALTGNEKARCVAAALCAVERRNEGQMERLFQSIKRGRKPCGPLPGENNMMLRTRCQGKP